MSLILQPVFSIEVSRSSAVVSIKVRLNGSFFMGYDVRICMGNYTICTVCTLDTVLNACA